MNVALISSLTKKFLLDNSQTILAGAGVVGTVTTGIFSFRAGRRVQILVEEENYKRELMAEEPATPHEEFKLFWRELVPSTAIAAGTVAMIISSVSIGNKRNAAIAAAYALSDKAHAEYKQKVVEHIGKNEERKVREAVDQERVLKNPPGNQAIIQGVGTVLCYDSYSGRYFYSDMESIRQAVNRVNSNVLNNYYASLTELYDQLGLDRTSFSDEVGWNCDSLLDVAYSTQLSDDNRPCIVMTFKVDPIRHFNRIN